MTSPRTALSRSRAEEFVEEISDRIVRSSGDRSTLRRTLGRSPAHPMAHQAHRLVARYIRGDDNEVTERAFYTVASLIAAQPNKARNAGEEPGEQPERENESEKTPPKNLGATLAEAVAAGKLKPDTTEARLMLLCRQSVDGVHRHLPRLIAQLRADLIPVDWATLLTDLSNWGTHRDQVTKQWLQDYYRTYHRITAAAKRRTAENTSEEP